MRRAFNASEEYICSAPRCKEKVQRRDKGSSANILTDEATSSLWPRWKSACSDLIETAALEMASFFLRFMYRKIKFPRNQVKEKVGNPETKINFGEKHEGARLVINQAFFAKLPGKGRNKGVARQGIKKRRCVIPLSKTNRSQLSLKIRWRVK
uniref:Uncharacterized protein n=1 Tax=Candidatus Kentrum sp. TC TaxID=2126339 RepID=A0A450Z7R6_9GAMM|nr:MAG: hypothetical protein BECKTC1821D_GA0114238_10835 [Candidatus Kentron sp. TC]